jgi:23S rRNA pseudouridine1911/1915/1917 synthase
MPPSDGFTFYIESGQTGQRLDRWVSDRMQVSRSRITELIRQGHIRLDGACAKPGVHVKPGQRVTGTLPPPEPIACQPEALSLDILYEDAHIIVINKPAGLVVHPAPGHPCGTLVNALLHHCTDLGGIGGWLRPGIVHRLDKDTSGVMVIAKQAASHEALVDQFQQRRVRKVYLALVAGTMPGDEGKIDLPIGRHPAERKKMSTHSRRGRESLTLWRVRERFSDASLLEVEIKTGRTHQIRVHLAQMQHPVLADPVYGGKRSFPPRIPAASRQMLHAWHMAFSHPSSALPMGFEAPMPPDMIQCIDLLRAGQ